MSFRNRLRLFFVVIVIVPMIAVGAVLFILIANAETGKDDARVSANSDAAVRIADDAIRDGQTLGREIATDVPFATAVRRNDIEALQARAEDLLRRKNAERIVIARGANRAAVDVGNASATFPGTVRLLDEDRRSFGRLQVSVVTPSAYAQRVKRLTGLEVMIMRLGGGVLTSTLRGAGRAKIADNTGEVRIGDTEYRTFAFQRGGFLSERLKVAVLGPRTRLSQDVRRNRILTGLLLAGFFILALTFALIVSRSLRSQMESFLFAARQLRSGDFSAQVPTVGRDEFAMLGDEFNQMSRQLEDRLVDLNRERGRLQVAMTRIGETFASNLDREALLEDRKSVV